MEGYSRRAILRMAGCGALSLRVRKESLAALVDGDELDSFITREMQAKKIPGLAACIVKSGKIVWSKGYGWSNVAGRVAMDPEQTIQNIGRSRRRFRPPQ